MPEKEKEQNRGGEGLDREALADQACKLIASQLGVPEKEVVPEANFVQDLGADSLDMVELALSFEETFAVSVPDKDLEHFTTVRGAIEQLTRLLLEKQAEPA